MAGERLAFSATALTLTGVAAWATIQDAPLPEGAEWPPERLFTELDPEATGVGFVHPIDTSHPLKYNYSGGYASGGVAIGDLDRDGWPDLVVTGGAVDNALYLQSETPLVFDDVTGQIPELAGSGKWAAGVALADIDADYDLDIYISYFDEPNQLFINETTEPGKPRFREDAATWGLAIQDAAFMPHFCDYDRDGDLDIYLTCEQYRDPAGTASEDRVTEVDGRLVVNQGLEDYYAVIRDYRGRETVKGVGRGDYLLKNLIAESRGRSPRFYDVTHLAGIRDIGLGNSARWWDYDQDGWMDLFVGNDFTHPDRLYRNLGDGTFTDVIGEAFPHLTWFSMGSDSGDINNDGFPDLLVSDMAGTTHYRSKVSMGEMGDSADFLKYARPQQYMRNAVFVSTGTERFMEAAFLTGLANTDWTWAAKLIDLDNDGWLDAYFTNGAARMFNHADMTVPESQRVGKTEWDLWEDKPTRLEENLAFRNLGDLEFKEVGEAWGLRRLSMSYAAAHGDLDRDGDLDLVVVNLEEPMSIFRNNGSGARAVQVVLVGGAANKFAVGTTVRLTMNGMTQMRVLMPESGFLASNEPLIHFGVGEASGTGNLEVIWPHGVREVYEDIASGHRYTITAPSSEPDIDGGWTREPVREWFTETREIENGIHREVEFDDFERQPLLPNKHSQLGPGLATGDLNGDGYDDFYFGGAAGQAGALFLGNRRAQPILSDQEAFRRDKDHEDMGAVFFDVDGDADLDLYVVSGGVEGEPGDARFQDRLYLNDGRGGFVKAWNEALPESAESGSSVAAADFDRDGDLDLFVGGRVVPGRYPVAPRSLLLENVSSADGPQLVDASRDHALGLSEVGMVTGALWTDANDDGWMDLMLACEWGPVRLFLNESAGSERILTDRTEDSGLGARSGWWNGLAAGDIDHDGDLDYLATNFGLNTKYHPKPGKPERLYFGDFDGTGAPHIVEAKYENGTLVPRRGLSCSSGAMPWVREKIPTFHQFGISTLQDIYTPNRLGASLQLEADTLETGLWLRVDDGTSDLPQFEFRELPRLAQIAPAFSAAITDADGDGRNDVFLAQNFYGPQVETGWMDGGLSLWLRGQSPADEEMGFALEPMGPADSGISIRGDAMAAALVDLRGAGPRDLLVSVNDDRWRGYVNRARAQSAVPVRLQGPRGNPTAVGARLTWREASRPIQVREVAAGQGYLSQGSSSVVFTKGPDFETATLTVRWPDGRITEHVVSSRDRALEIAWPAP